MVRTLTSGMVKNFMGSAPDWYKLTILHFLVLNPILLFTLGPEVAGWALVFEFIFTLAMALKCYPLQPGGLLALEAIFIGLTTPGTVIHEVEAGLEVILLLIFMVAGIYFLKDLLLFIFTKILLAIRSKIVLSVLFSFVAAVLSAFLDALTVTAVVITVAVGFFSVYHKVASGKNFGHEHDHSHDEDVQELHRSDLEQFRAFLRSLVMHAVVGTALGGVCTIVGEPQNLLIGEHAGWNFVEFFLRMSPISIPVLFAGLLTAVMLERFKLFGFGTHIPAAVRQILVDFDASETEKRTIKQKAILVSQALVGVWLVIGLLFHLAPVGLIGLSVIVLATISTGVIEEHQIGKAFEEALPFTALLVVFFAVVAVINDQGLFKPVIDWVLTFDGHDQLIAFYLANGILSAISDNVFVASVYIGEVEQALRNGLISRDQFDLLAIAINTGTNIPSVATPNGQAAFLFLLTSALAPLIRLSYMRMVIMAFPYMVIMTTVGLIAAMTLLEPVTDFYYDAGWLHHHSASEIPGPPAH